MTGRQAQRPGAGFTLLELLVAVAIFAVLSTLAYGGVRHLLRLESGLLRASSRYEQLKFAAILLEQDLLAVAPRSIRDGLGEREPALRAGVAGELLSFTRLAPALPGTGPAVALRRVRYRLEDGSLYRDVWDQLDRTPATVFKTQRLLDGVAALRLRFFAEGAWLDFWPRDDTAIMLDSLPRGIELRLEFTDAQSLRRVLVLPG